MKQPEKNLPFSSAALVLGGISVPLAFAWHLCSLAVVLGAYATALGLWGKRRAGRHLLVYSVRSTKRAIWATRLGATGLIAGIVMWILYATNWLLT